MSWSAENTICVEVRRKKKCGDGRQGCDANTGVDRIVLAPWSTPVFSDWRRFPGALKMIGQSWRLFDWFSDERISSGRCLWNSDLLGVSFLPLPTTNPEKKRSWYCITELDTVPLVAAVYLPAGLASSTGEQKRSDRLFIQLVLSEKGLGNTLLHGF